MPSSLPDYASFQAALQHQQLGESAAQAHGFFCGFLCAQPDAAIVDTNVTLFSLARTIPELNQLYEITKQQFSEALEENSMALKLFLPVEESALPHRIATLGQWCQGFLSGLGEGGLTAAIVEQVQLDELLQDISLIARVDNEDQLDADTLTEEDERDYVQISDYISLAALAIYTDMLVLNHAADSDSTQDLI